VKPLSSAAKSSRNNVAYTMLPANDQTMRLIMWWGLLVGGIALLGFAVEFVEAWWLAQKARKELGILRTQVHAGQHWDALRGNWSACVDLEPVRRK
jgi:hypothetical protein